MYTNRFPFTAKLADTEKYDIPVITEDSVLALHVQIVHSDENKRKDRGFYRNI